METKADLLIPHGYTEEAMKFYRKVYEKDKNNYHIKKIMFEIEYEKIDKSHNNSSQEFFNNYSDLLMIFQNNSMLHNKLRKIALLLKKDDWVNFIDTNIFLNDISTKKLYKN